MANINVHIEKPLTIKKINKMLIDLNLEKEENIKQNLDEVNV